MVRKVTTGDYKRDVVNPLFIEGERRVYEWLVASGKDVTDCRKQHTFYDFLINSAWTLDCKVDQWGKETGNVVYEDTIILSNGESQKGWGRKDGLIFIVYVFPGKPDEQWDAILVQLPRMRESLDAIKSTGISNYSHAVKQFRKDGTDGRSSIGYAVNLEWLQQQDCILRRFTV